MGKARLVDPVAQPRPTPDPRRPLMDLKGADMEPKGADAVLGALRIHEGLPRNTRGVSLGA